MSGDTQANTVKFPLAGRSSVYKLTGAIEHIPINGPSLSTVQVTMDAYEASELWDTLDAIRAGPSEQAALATLITNAIRRERDLIKIRALSAFAALGGDVTTIGDGTGTIDVLHVEQARAQIAGTGADESGEAQVFAAFPAMWMTQLCFYKEFADATWVGLDNAPFSKTQRMRMKTVRGVNYIEVPDEYVTEYDTGKQEAFMWHKQSMGAETPWNREAPSISPLPQLKGNIYAAKAQLMGAAIGIQGKGVKRIRMKTLTTPVRPAIHTIADT
jgi:hypothetical protein